MVLLKFILLIFVFLFIMGVVTLYTFINKVRSTARRFQERQSRRQTKVDGNIIYDSRPPEESRKQIIPDDEGEYVDYEE